MKLAIDGKTQEIIFGHSCSLLHISTRFNPRRDFSPKILNQIQPS